MRIAVDIRSLTAPHKTGVGIVTESIVRAMAVQAPDDEFLLFATGSEEALMNIPEWNLPNVTVAPLRVPNKLANLLWSLPIGPTMERFLPVQPDVWLFPNAHIHKTQLPYTVIFHDAAIKTMPECFTLKDHLRAGVAQETTMFRAARSVIAVSEHSRRDAIEYYGVASESIVAAPLGVDHTVFLPREQPSDRSYRAAYDLNRPYILWLATREPRKNADAVIRAYTLFRDRGGAAIPLVLAGAQGWKTKHIDEALRSSPYQSDIRAHLYVPEKHKAALYRGATVFVFPSLYEGFGLPVLEAMACGVPVITSLTSSLPDVVGNAALLIDPLNITDLAHALTQLLDGENGAAFRSKLVARSLVQAKTFSWNATATIVLDALRSPTPSLPLSP